MAYHEYLVGKVKPDERCPKERRKYGGFCHKGCSVGKEACPLRKEGSLLTSTDPKANPGKAPAPNQTRQKTGSRYPNGN